MNTTQKVLSIIANVQNAVAKSPTGVTFVKINNYTNKSNETANHLINVGISYDNVRLKDIQFLLDMDITLQGFKSSKELLLQAKDELLEGLTTPNENRSNGQKDAYTTISNGIKVNNETGLLYIYGYREKKDIITEGTYKEVKSKPLTIAKNEIKKLLRTNKFTQFQLEIGNEIKVNKETIEL